MMSFCLRGCLAWACVLIVLLSGRSSAESDEIATLERLDLDQALLDAFPTSNDLNEPGYILSLMRSGEIIYEAQSGAADIEQARRLDGGVSLDYIRPKAN